MKQLLLFFLIVCSYSYAQNGFTAYTCTITGTAANYRNKSSFTIDNTGNKWVGFKRLTVSGFALVKYDGSTWTNHTSDINAQVTALESDPSGNVWIGTVDSGLVKYDGVTFTRYKTINSGIIANTINGLSYINNKLYIGTPSGFSVFDGMNFTNFNQGNSGISSNNVFSFKGDASQVWIGTADGLNTFNGVNTISYTGSNDTIHVIEIDSNGDKWLGTNSHGLVRYNSSGFTNLKQLIPDIHGAVIPSAVYSVLLNANGNLMVNAEKNLYGFNRKDAALEILPDYSYKLYYFPAEYISQGINHNWYFRKDNSGNLFFIDMGVFTTISTSYHVSTFLYSLNTNVYSSAASLSNITPENTQYLDINEVKAACNPGADIHWDGSKSRYEVPKGSGSTPTHGTSMWMGGYVNGQLRIAANTYRQNGVDFWPGPINSNAVSMSDSTYAILYNKVWKVNRFDIENFKFNFLNGNVQNGSYSIPDVIMNWPWIDQENQPLAPFYDYNNDQIYSPMEGDYPLIKGDQMIWWVMNDMKPHFETGSVSPMGIQVMVSAYAYHCPDIHDSDKVINYTTFYNYKIWNKSTDVIDSMRIGVWTDSDLGFYNDDYVGCDVQNNFSYVYNGDNYDEDYLLPWGDTVTGYHSNTPFFAVNFLRGPAANIDDNVDNDRDGCIDCTFDIDPFTGQPLPTFSDEFALPEYTSMGVFTSYDNNNNIKKGNPISSGGGIQYYKYMNGNWRDGSFMRYDGAQGTGASGPPTTYLYPGTSDPLGYGVGGGPDNPQSQAAWTEITAGNSPGDRRFLTSTGKFTLQPGFIAEFDYAYVFTQDGTTVPTSYNKVVSDNKKIKRWFRDHNAPSCIDLSGVGLKESNIEIRMNVYPNPANNSLFVDAGNNNTITAIKIMDVLGKEISSHNNINKSVEQLNISTFPAGVYLLQVTSQQGSYFCKFIKH